MADPLSIAGSIAGLVSIANAVFRKIHHFSRTVRKAEAAVLELPKEISVLTGILHNLHLIADDLETRPHNYSVRVDHINACLGTLYTLQESLKMLEFLADDAMTKTWHKVQWPFKITETNELCDEIKLHRGTIQLALSADTLTASQRIQNIENLVTQRFEIDTRIEMDQKRVAVLNHFSKGVDPQTYFSTNAKLRHSTTGFWLTKHRQFQTWMTESGSRLWLSGIPGAGKSVLASLIVQSCINASNEQFALAYYYCDYKSPDTQQIVTILGCIAIQIAKQHEDGFRYLQQYHNQLKPPEKYRQTPQFTNAENFCEVIKKLVKCFLGVRIVIDRLDECGEDTRDTCQWLDRLFCEDTTNVSVALLSRDVVEVRQYFGSRYWSHMEVAAQTRDAEHYVRTEIETRLKTKSLRFQSMELKELVTSSLIAKCAGM